MVIIDCTEKIIVENPQKYGKAGYCYVHYRGIAIKKETRNTEDRLADLMVSTIDIRDPNGSFPACPCIWGYCEIFYRDKRNADLANTLLNHMRRIREIMIDNIIDNLRPYKRGMGLSLADYITNLRVKLIKEDRSKADLFDDFVLGFAADLKRVSDEVSDSDGILSNNTLLMEKMRYFIGETLLIDNPRNVYFSAPDRTNGTEYK